MHVRSLNRSVALAIACLGVLASACEKKPAQPAPAPSPPPAAKASYEFGVIAKSQSNPVFQAARTGAEDAARALSERFGVEVKINWRTPNAEDAQQQAQFIEQLVSQGVDGITVSCSDANILTSAIDAAVAKGVTVVTFDSDAPASTRMAYYGINDVEAGKALMRELARAMGDKGGAVAVLAGNQNAPNLQARVAGVKEELAAHPNLTLKEVYYHKETANDAAAMVQQVQTNNPDIAGWAMVGGWPLFTQNALDGVYEKAKVAAVDTLPEQLEYVKKGQVVALIGQDCYGWGYRTVEMLFDKVHSGKTPDKVVNNFDLAVVTQGNVAEYEGLWQKWLGKK